MVGTNQGARWLWTSCHGKWPRFMPGRDWWCYWPSYFNGYMPFTAISLLSWQPLCAGQDEKAGGSFRKVKETNPIEQTYWGKANRVARDSTSFKTACLVTSGENLDQKNMKRKNSTSFKAACLVTCVEKLDQKKKKKVKRKSGVGSSASDAMMLQRGNLEKAAAPWDL